MRVKVRALRLRRCAALALGGSFRRSNGTASQRGTRRQLWHLVRLCIQFDGFEHVSQVIRCACHEPTQRREPKTVAYAVPCVQSICQRIFRAFHPTTFPRPVSNAESQRKRVALAFLGSHSKLAVLAFHPCP